MSANTNCVIISGRLTKKPVTKEIGNSKVSNFRIAVNRRFKRDGQPEADFFDCVVFGRNAEFSEKYLDQGTKLVIQGRLQNNNYQDKEGRMVYRTEIVVETMEFAESKKTQSAPAPQAQPQAQAQPFMAPPAPPAQPAPQPQAQPYMAPPQAQQWQPAGVYEEEELPFV